MGAYGSGRRAGFSTSRTTDSVLRIDVQQWKREGRLEPATYFTWRWQSDGRTVRKISVYPDSNVLLVVEVAKDGGQLYNRIDLAHTDCHFGGMRTWFVCPAVGCGRRAAILYGGEVFACRHCYRLTYQSQRESPADRAGRRAEKLRERLGWPGGILVGSGDRPKGMHERTFRRLRARYQAAVAECLADARSRFGDDFLSF